MTRSLYSLARVVLVAVAVLRELDGAARQPYDETVTGRLAIVEPTAARITVIADGEVELRSLNVAPDAQIRRGNEELTLSELVIQVGHRVAVRFRTDEGAVIATEITVEPER